MNYIDTHCDTAFEIYKKKEPLFQNSLHISLDAAQEFEKYAQIMAIWSQSDISNGEGWSQFGAILDNLRSEIEKNEKAALCTSFAECENAFSEGKRGIFLGVEGGNILDAKIWRLDELYDEGVRFLTLVWKGEGCIGGAYDTEAGLTAFGRRVAKTAMEKGIIVDVSHGSGALTDECLSLAEEAGKPVIATHSNSYAVCEHPRNLTDERAKRIAALGGTIGISMAPPHLNRSGTADIADILAHIAHYLDIGLENNVCMGCDFDGVSSLPVGITGIRDIEKLGAAVEKEFSSDIADKIFFRNAESFLRRFL